MKIFFKALFFFFLPVNIFWFTSCIFTSDESPPVAQGGGSDSETLTGFVFAASGKPAVKSLVKLIPVDYDPSKPDLNVIRYANTNDSGIAFFPGTDILTHCDGINASKVDSVPVGALHFIVQSQAGWKQDTTLVSVPDTQAITAQASGITVIP